MSDDVHFVDTNVLVYAHDTSAGTKRQQAQELIEELWLSRSGVISTQVLQEFYVTVTRKVARPISPQLARQIVASYGAWPVHRPNVDDIVTASEVHERNQVSFWDALIIVSAQRLGASVLLSEDLQSGRRLGNVVVINPFNR